MLKTVLRITALAEGGMGLACLVAPALPSELLFGQPKTTPLDVVLGRFVGGIALANPVVLVCGHQFGDRRLRCGQGDAVLRRRCHRNFSLLWLRAFSRRNPAVAGRRHSRGSHDSAHLGLAEGTTVCNWNVNGNT